jgi:hypothetical protein
MSIKHVGWVVVVGPIVEVETGMVEFVVHSLAQRAAGSPVNIYVHKAEMALPFCLHSELNALVFAL